MNDFDAHSEDFLVSLAGGGGPEPLHTALARKFHQLAQGSSRCAILSPLERPARYVQAIVTGAGIRVESVSSHYLDDLDDDALTPDQVATLEALGWLPPPDDDPDWPWPYNWWREFPGPEAASDAAGLLVATLIEVHELGASEALHLEVFPASNPTHRWAVDSAHPCGGQLVAV